MNKNGFTLIELLTVIAILGILTLLSISSFLGYTEKTNIVKIQTGIESVETVVDAKYLENPNLTEDWIVLTQEEIQKINDSNKLINREGLLKKTLDEGAKHIPLKELEVIWNSGGLFILGQNEESVYYYNENYNPIENEETPYNPGELPDNPDEGYEPGELPGNSDDEYDDSDFIWIKTTYGYGYPVNGEEGYFKYIGNKTTVVIPNKIHGHPMTSYYNMFSETNVSKVISHNKNITDMKKMFEASKASFLNLSELDTSNVTDMEDMFEMAHAKSFDFNNFDTSNVTNMRDMFTSTEARYLNLSGFDTSNVTNMFAMFSGAHALVINLSSFDTSNVTDMTLMFAGAQTMTLDLSSFDTSNVTRMEDMFSGAFALYGYARNSTEAEKFNKLLSKEDTLKFKVKEN